MATGAKKREKERVHQIAASAPIQKVEEKEQNEQKEQEVEISRCDAVGEKDVRYLC